jgi:hypothetical protein
LATLQDNSYAQAKVEVSYMEIYNEKVHDLLDLTSNGKIGLKVHFPILYNINRLLWLGCIIKL